MHDADTIVIGSGAGGLAAALALAQAGEKVLVLEQHYVPGGWSQSFQQKGYRFSPGVHYIGQVGPGQGTHQLYEGMGLGQDLEFFEMNPDGFEHFHVGTERFDLPSGREAMVERYTERFPSEGRSLREFFSLVQSITDQVAIVPNTRTFLEFLTVPYRTRHMGRFSVFSLKRILDHHFKDPLLRAFLSMQCGDHGLPPSMVSFTMHAAVMGHYLNGGYYPKGGAASLPKAWLRGLRRAGGEIQLSTPVEKIILENGRAIGVRLADGRSLRSKRVISNASPHLTYQKLIGEEHLGRRLKKKLAKAKYSIASISLFMATDIDLRALGFDSGNTWYSPHADGDKTFGDMMNPDIVNQDELPGLFMGVTSLKDPGSFADGHHVLEAVTFVTFDAFAPFAHEKFGERSDAYKALKEKITQTMLNMVEKFIPGIKDHLLHVDLGTPLSNEHYVCATRGNSYGTEKTLNQLGPFGFGSTSPFAGLTLCGASVAGHGISGASSSGLEIAAGLLKCRTEELFQKNPVPLQVHSAEDSEAWPQWVHDKRAMRSGS